MNKGKIIRKLLGQPSGINPNSNSNPNPPSHPHEGGETGNIESPLPPRPSSSQHTVYAAGNPVACLDRSPDGQHAVIAGAKVFKTLRIDGSTITEDIDLRTIISTYASTHDSSAASSEQLNIKAVQWSHGNLDTTIVTACGNGRIALYDLNKVGEGLEVGRILEHNRQVHKLAINPFMCHWLLSASQDRTVKQFDIRAPINSRAGITFRTVSTFNCHAEAIRDVQWSPTDGMEFACASDTGAVQKWDIRKSNAPMLRISAHTSACLSISWHPDGEHLISGGTDQHCHVWDVSKKAERNQKPRYSFTTPAPISAVSWRPPCWSATAQGNRVAQVTVVYDETNSSNKVLGSTVNIWDLARPTLPFKEIEHWDTSPTGIIWNTRDLLWSVDGDGNFTQTDVAFVPKVIDRRSLSNFAFTPNGEVLMMLEERQVPRRPRPSMSSPAISPSFQHKPNESILSVSRSDSEEDGVSSFLGYRQRKHRRRHSGRSARSLSTTPPTVTGMIDKKVMALDDSVNLTGIYKPQQVIAFGQAPSTVRPAIYGYLTNKYLHCMANDTKFCLDLSPANIYISNILESFARTAESVAHYRLAQTWRILGLAMNMLLTRRAEHHRKSRLMRLVSPALIGEPRKDIKNPRGPDQDQGTATPRDRQPVTPSLPNPHVHITPKSTIIDETESTSNVATPLARPMRDSIIQETSEAMHTPLVENDVLKLPPAAYSASPNPIPLPGTSHSSDNTVSSVDGYDFYGMELFSPAVDPTVPPRKRPLRFDYSETNNQYHRTSITRHDSGESFQMFSTSGDSQPLRIMSSSGSEMNSSSQGRGQSLRERVSSWESNISEKSSNGSSASSDVPVQSKSPAHYAPPIPKVKTPERNGISENKISPPVFRLQEASVASADGMAQVTDPAGEEILLFAEKSRDPNIIESDFLPWANDPAFTIYPMDPVVLVQRTIEFEAHSGVLNVSALILLLRPLLPPGSIDEIQATAILRQYQHRLMGMKLFTESALLRNLCVPLYPTVFGPAQENVSVGYFCTDCQKPLENDPLIPNSVWRCNRCQGSINGCAICRERDLSLGTEYEASENVALISVWWYCPGCGHGGHTSCMQAWHAGDEHEEGNTHSGGGCPLDGCLHPCIPGNWRSQRAEEKRVSIYCDLEGQVKQEMAQKWQRSVRRDHREVTQSKAVEGVRVALGVNSFVGLDRKKSVKVVAPGEERS
ncbi:hypothetical protein B7494_g7 [Chlorociboria aeruginascens]|nr:hypothetical protein B7494_g7 [Chlorociboria aeruginascens]